MAETQGARADGVRPIYREADVVLRDGSTVHVRTLRSDDAPRLLAFFRSLSEDSRRLRFFGTAVDLAAEAQRESRSDDGRRFGLVAIVGLRDRIVGHASYKVLDQDRAEVAFAIADGYQGRGLGTLLLGHLAEVAAAGGIRMFEAQVLPANYRMLDAFRQSGFPVEVRTLPEELLVTFPTLLTEASLECFERREQAAAVNALLGFLCPRSVAVIGASRQRGTVGGEVFHNLLAYEFAGPVYPVNLVARVVQSVPAYPTIEVIPGNVDLAVVAVPAAHVPRVAEQCGRQGVRALLVLSAGFSEAGEAGLVRQTELVRLCRAAGMRLIGPNCLGVVNTDPAVRLNATFGPHVPPSGRVGFASQSGALGLAAIDYAGTRALGISSFVSLGNKADISSNDLLNYWESDPRTDVVLLYLESLGNPRKFSRIARRVGRTKPIVVVKSGRSAAGARATASHTGALLAASDVTVDALFTQAGVIRTDTLEQLFDVASLLASQPLPEGRRVGIVTNVGGPAILCADACAAEGLEVGVLDDETQARLRAFLPAEASTANPVDLLATASAEHYQKAIGLVAGDPNVDAVIAVFLPPLAVCDGDVARAIVQATREIASRLPVLAVFMSSQSAPDALRTPEVSVPSYAFPESAALALAHAARYSAWRQRPVAPPIHLQGLRRDEAAALVAAALGRGGGWLGPEEVAQLLSCYGLSLAEQRVAATPEAAGAMAEALGGEVALKAIAPGVLHKTEAGAVRLSLRGAEAVRQTAQSMAAGLAAASHPPTAFVVQRMIPDGVEMLVGIVHDPLFGPVLACGAGGVLAELLKDIAVRLTPLRREEASEMLRSLRTYPLLEGYRGAPACDVRALEEVLVRVSTLAEDLPQIAELDCNPVRVLERGATIVDARIRVEPVTPPLPLGARS